MRTLTARQRAIVLDSVEEQLAHQPQIETTHRKRMRPNPVAPWELRIGDLRVYYDIIDEAEPSVLVLAVGLKRRSAVWIGGVEIRI